MSVAEVTKETVMEYADRMFDEFVNQTDENSNKIYLKRLDSGEVRIADIMAYGVPYYSEEHNLVVVLSLTLKTNDGKMLYLQSLEDKVLSMSIDELLVSGDKIIITINSYQAVLKGYEEELELCQQKELAEELLLEGDLALVLS